MKSEKTKSNLYDKVIKKLQNLSFPRRRESTAPNSNLQNNLKTVDPRLRGDDNTADENISSRENEFDIIAKYFSPLAKKFPGAMNLTDDAAILPYENGYDFVVTKDLITEGTHFLKTDSAATLARKILGVNISDLAAMGAEPVAYLLGLVLPKTTNEKWLADFSLALQKGISEFGGHLIGGDTTSTTGGISLSLTAIGKVKKGKSLTRAGAKIGDKIFVSGTIGDSYLGLQVALGKISLPKKAHDYFLDRYNIPQPRIKLGRELVGIATSCIDISDGLVADLKHICECSAVGAEIYAEKIPLSSLTSQSLVLLEDMITAGDDYELLFTCPANKSTKAKAIAKKIGLQITQIGEITQGKKVNLLDINGKKIALKKEGYKHF